MTFFKGQGEVFPKNNDNTSIALTKSLVYAQQPFIVDAYQINHCISQKPTLKSQLVNFKHGLRRAGFIPFLC